MSAPKERSEAPEPKRQRGASDADASVTPPADSGVEVETAPAVSVIMPCRNAMPWLPDCVASVLAQEGLEADGGLELIVADDASTDGSTEWLAACEAALRAADARRDLPPGRRRVRVGGGRGGGTRRGARRRPRRPRRSRRKPRGRGRGTSRATATGEPPEPGGARCRVRGRHLGRAVFRTDDDEVLTRRLAPLFFSTLVGRRGPAPRLTPRGRPLALRVAASFSRLLGCSRAAGCSPRAPGARA